MRSVLPTHLSRLLAGLLVLTACGAAPAAPPPIPPPAPAAAHGGHSTSAVGLYAVQSGPLGVVATDSEGHLLYRSDADTADPPASACTGDCAVTWIPLVVADGAEPELLGVDEALVGRLARAEGEQLTLAGWPLYRHRDDSGELLDTGQNGAGNTWFAITPTGDKATPA
jgi:predicted lipoprotein with Yx(FWY)xxD motif